MAETRDEMIAKLELALNQALLGRGVLLAQTQRNYRINTAAAMRLHALRDACFDAIAVIAALATPPPADLAAQVETLTREKQAAEQRHAALVAVVKRVQDKRETLEWNGDRGMEYTAPIVCPACNEPEHTADCPLDALLAYPLGDTTP